MIKLQIRENTEDKMSLSFKHQSLTGNFDKVHCSFIS